MSNKIKIGDIVRVTNMEEMLATTVEKVSKDAIWIVVDQFRNNHNAEMYVLQTLINNSSDVLEDAAYPSALCVIQNPTKYERFIASLIKETSTSKKSQRIIKLEDMTLKQIRDLKQRIVDEIHFAINKATSGYDVGKIVINAKEERLPMNGHIVYSNPITIKFGDEIYEKVYH